MNVNSRLKQHLRENKQNYIVIVLIFILGIFFGYQKVYLLDEEVRANLLGMINNYLLGGYKGSINGNHIFLSAFIQQLKTVFLVWFLGLTVIGIPLILAVVFVRGFSLGFAVGFLIHEKAGAGVIISIISILPQNIIYIPLIIVWAAIAVNFSLYLVKGRDTRSLPLSKGLVSYFLLLLTSIIFILVGNLIEAYLSPWFLSLFL